MFRNSNRGLTYRKVFGIAVIAGLCFLSLNPAQSADKYKVINKVTLGGDGGWDALCCDADGRRIYISRATHVMVLDADSLAVVGDIPDTQGVHGIAVAREFNKGFTSNGRTNSVSIFDLKTLKTTSSVSVGANPDGIIYDTVSKRVFVFNGRSNDASVIDAAKGTLVGTIALGGRPEFPASNEKGIVYINIEDKNEIVAIDAKALKIKNRWSIAPGDGPSGLAIDTKTHRLFSVCGQNKMIISDADAGKVIITMPIGNRPDGADFDAGRGLAFSSNGDGTLSIIKEDSSSKFSSYDTVTTEPGARTLVLDPKTHNVILPAAKYKAEDPTTSTATTGQRRRPTMEPGSFMVVVVNSSK